MSGRKGNLASRSLEYRAPEVPAFLRALKAQVASSDRYATNTHRSDELDCLVTSTSSSGKRKARDDDDQDAALDSEDEMNGAQVVVLKDGKHLTHDEALSIKTTQAMQNKQAGTVVGGSDAIKTQNIAASGSGGPTKRRRDPIGASAEPSEKVSITSIIDNPRSNKAQRGSKTGRKGDLDDVKQLIRQQRESRAPPKSTPTEDKEKTKETRRKEKNAQARKLKAKSGKGLSFNLDDE